IRCIARALDDELQNASVAVESRTAELAALSGSDTETHPADDPYRLSSREMEVMTHVWRGLSDKQIAHVMGISRFTVAKHVGTAVRKMNGATPTAPSALCGRRAV